MLRCASKKYRTPEGTYCGIKWPGHLLPPLGLWLKIIMASVSFVLSLLVQSVTVSLNSFTVVMGTCTCTIKEFLNSRSVASKMSERNGEI